MSNRTSLANFAYTTGGTLAPDAPSYVERQADKTLLSNLLEGETCYVLNSRQMGKSSLCVRTIGRLKEAGVRTAFCDLTKFGGRNLSAEQWYAALLSEVGRDLGLRNEFLAYWKENAHLPPVQRLFGAITELGLRDGASVVVFVDEIDVTLSLPFSADEFFAAIRQCYVGRATDERLKKLSFCLLGTATPADLIQDTRVSPFNIGKRIELGDFTEGEAMPLASGLGDPALLKRVLFWTGGHPYLTQRLCQAVRESGTQDVDRVCSDLFLTHAAKDSDDNLAFVRNRLLKSEADIATLLDLYRKMRTGKPVQDDETNPLCALLKLSGVARVEGGKLKVRNHIYEHVFDPEWVETHMPDAEKRRQKEAYRRGVTRTLAVSTAVVVLIASLAAYGLISAKLARESEGIARKLSAENERNLYFAKISVMQSDFAEGNFRRIGRYLEETAKSSNRGFEWGYWNKQRKRELITLHGHQSSVYTSSFSPDGSKIISASDDRTARVWDSRTGRELLKLKNPKSSVYGALLSADGSQALTLGGDSICRLWNALDGRLIHEFRSAVYAFFAQHGMLVVTKTDGSVFLIDKATFQVARHIKGPLALAQALSPDCSILASGDLKGRLSILSLKTGKAVKSVQGHRDTIIKIAFSRDGHLLLTSGLDNHIYIWEAASLTRIGDLPIRLPMAGGSFSPDGALVACGGLDRLVSVWDWRSKTKVAEMKGHSSNIWTAAYSQDGKTILSSSADGTLKIWSTRPKAVDQEFQGPAARISSLAFSPDGRRLLTGCEDNVARLWDVGTGKILRTYRGHHPGEIMWDQAIRYGLRAAFIPGKGQVVTVSVDGTAKIWDENSAQVIRTIRGGPGICYGLAVFPDGHKFVTGGVKDAAIYDIQTGAKTKTLTGHSDIIGTVDVSPDGRRIITGSWDGSARIWDAESGHLLAVLAGHTSYVYAVSFSPNGKWVATASPDGSARIWDSTTGLRKLTIGELGAAISLSVSPKADRLAIGFDNGNVTLVDTELGRQCLTMKGSASQARSVAISADGTAIAWVTDDGVVHVRSVDTNEQGFPHQKSG